MGMFCYQCEQTAGGTMLATSGTYWGSFTVTTLTYDRTVPGVTQADTVAHYVQYKDGNPNPVTPDPAPAAREPAALAAALTRLSGLVKEMVGEAKESR